MNTPYFIINANTLDNLSNNLISAVEKNWPNYVLGYSYKTNSNKWVIDHMKQLGFFAEVVSNDEYEMSQVIGSGNKVIYNGIAKSKESFIQAVSEGCIVNIDSWNEIDWLDSLNHDQNYKIGIRVNFDIEAMCPGQSSGGVEGSRFGFCEENGELLKAIEQIKQKKHVCLAGLHLHCSSKTRGIDIYKAIAKEACFVKRKYGLDLDYVDVGGGFFGGVQGKPQFDDYLREITLILQESFDIARTKIILEPGMSLIGASVSYVTSVVDVKKTSLNTFVVTDGSRMHIDPLLRKSSYSYRIEKSDNGLRDNLGKQVVAGFTCMENDRLFDLLDCEELFKDDRVIYEKVGAYTLCLAPQFIKYLPEIYVEENDSLTLIENHWSARDLMREGQ